MDHPHMKEVWRCPKCFISVDAVAHHTHCECKCGHSMIRDSDCPKLVHKDDENARLFFGSGAVTTKDPLVSFFYELIRDHVPLGIVEQIVRRSPQGTTHLTNGWLAQYAMDVADRLKEK